MLKYTGKSNNLYHFINNGQKLSLPLQQAVALINSISVKERNCKVSRGKPSLKPNKGNIKPGSKPVVRIVTPKTYKYDSLLKNTDNFICNNDWYFYKVATDSSFLHRHKNLLKDIDNAKIVNEYTLEMRTPFGITSVHNLSTGLKTLLNILYVKETVSHKICVNMSEVGDNLIPFVLEAAADSNVTLFINHIAGDSNTDYDFIIDGRHFKDFFDVGRVICGEY